MENLLLTLSGSERLFKALEWRWSYRPLCSANAFSNFLSSIVFLLQSPLFPSKFRAMTHAPAPPWYSKSSIFRGVLCFQRSLQRLPTVLFQKPSIWLILYVVLNKFYLISNTVVTCINSSNLLINFLSCHVLIFLVVDSAQNLVEYIVKLLYTMRKYYSVIIGQFFMKNNYFIFRKRRHSKWLTITKFIARLR